MALLFHYLKINAFITGPTAGTIRCQFWNMTVELKSILLQKKNLDSVCFRKLRIKYSCWSFSFLEEKNDIFGECFLLQIVLETFVLCLCFQEWCRSYKYLPFWTQDVFLFHIDFRSICWCVFRVFCWFLSGFFWLFGFGVVCFGVFFVWLFCFPL